MTGKDLRWNHKRLITPPMPISSYTTVTVTRYNINKHNPLYLENTGDGHASIQQLLATFVTNTAHE